MGWIHYLGRAPSRERLVRGDTPAWIANSERRSYIASRCYFEIQTARESVEAEFKLPRAMNLNHWTDVGALRAVTARFGKMARRS